MLHKVSLALSHPTRHNNPNLALQASPKTSLFNNLACLLGSGLPIKRPVLFFDSILNFAGYLNAIERLLHNSNTSQGVQIGISGYPASRLTAWNIRMRSRFTMCLKFQLTKASTPASDASAICRASALFLSETAPLLTYLSARVIASGVSSITLMLPGGIRSRTSRTAGGANSNSRKVCLDKNSRRCPTTNRSMRILDGCSNSSSRQPPNTDVSV